MCDYRKVVRFLDQGADIDQFIDFGDEVFDDHSDWQKAVELDNRDEGLDPDSDPPMGSYSPLTAALDDNVGMFGTHVARFLIGIGADVNSCSRGGKTPLMRACELRQFDLIDLLLRKNARADLLNHQNRSVLHFACEFGAPLRIVKSLFHVNPDLLHGQCLSNKSALMLASEGNTPEVVNFLIEKGAKLEVTDIGLRTALHIACIAGKTENIAALVGHGANVNAVCKLSFSSIGVGDESTPLVLCCSQRLGESVKLILSSRAPEADLDAVNKDGDTALIAACGERWGSKAYSVYSLVPKKDTPADLIRMLIKSYRARSALSSVRAYVNAANKLKLTALHKSARFGDLTSCKLLVSHGADLYAKDKSGQTPLDVYGMEQSFLSIVSISSLSNQPRPKEPILSDEEKANHCKLLLQARRVYEETPLKIALLSGRFLTFLPEVLPLPLPLPLTLPLVEAEQPPNVNVADNRAIRRVMSNPDLLNLIILWL